MRVLGFRHVPFEGFGLIEPALTRRGIAIEEVDLFDGRPVPPDWRTAAGIISMGGPMSANDDLPFVREELNLLECAVNAGKPVLGVCLGSQLLARALGARVYRNPVKEIGWAPIQWTGAARGDPLFSSLEGDEVVFHWHGETFDLPGGAELLASSTACRNQAFRFGDRAWGLQFHLEVTPQMIAGWLQEDANSADLREVTAPIDPRLNSERLAELAGLVFGRWADVVRRGAGQ